VTVTRDCEFGTGDALLQQYLVNVLVDRRERPFLSD
jgi:hypothetical protein